jgi:hypothetical protein
MRKHLILVYALIALFFLAGFTSSDQVVIDTITKRIEKLESDYSFLANMETQNATDIYSLKSMYAYGCFDATKPNSGFARIDNEKGIFYVTLDSVIKSNNSYNLNFLIGNPQYCTYKGLNIDLIYNTALGSKSLTEWFKLEKSLTTKLQNTILTPGAWNPVSVNIPVSNITDIAYIEFKFSIDAVSMTVLSNTSSTNTPEMIINNSAQTVIESKIDGDFEGTNYGNIYKLWNGQIWQQTSYEYHYHYAYSPNVIIYKSGNAYKMKIDGVNDTIMVKQLK